MSLGRAVALGIAYIVPGAVYIWHKLNENNYGRVPPFILRYRTEGGAGLLVAVFLSWPIATFINREFSYWLMFACIAVIGVAFWAP